MRTRCGRAQVALEFMLLAGFFLLVFLIMTAYFASLQRSEITDREYLIGREITSIVSDEVHAALLGGPGYEKAFQLPTTLAGSDYSLKITLRSSDSTAFAEVSWFKGTEQFEYANPLATRIVFKNGVAISAPGSASLNPKRPITIKNIATGSGGDIDFVQS